MTTYTFDKKDYALWNKTFTKQKNYLRQWATDSKNIHQFLDKLLTNFRFDNYSNTIDFRAIHDERYLSLFEHFYSKNLNLYHFIEKQLTVDSIVNSQPYLIFAYTVATQLGTKVPHLEEDRLDNIIQCIQKARWHDRGVNNYVAFTFLKNSPVTAKHVNQALDTIEKGYQDLQQRSINLPLHWQQEIIDYVEGIPSNLKPKKWEHYCSDLLDSEFYSEELSIAFQCKFNINKVMATYSTPTDPRFFRYQKALHLLYEALITNVKKGHDPFIPDIKITHTYINYEEKHSKREDLSNKHEDMIFSFIVPDSHSQEKISTFFNAVAPVLLTQISNGIDIEAHTNPEFIRTTLFNHKLAQELKNKPKVSKTNKI